jgi:hypothetical protein
MSASKNGHTSIVDLFVQSKAEMAAKDITVSPK